MLENRKRPSLFYLSSLLCLLLLDQNQEEFVWLEENIMIVNRNRNGHARPLLFILGLLKQTMQFSGTTNKCKNLAINYPVLGFEPTTSHEWVSSHNHYKDHYLYYLVDRYIATRAIAYALSNFWQNNPMLIWLLLMIKSYYSRAVVLDKWSARSPSTLKIRVRIPA